MNHPIYDALGVGDYLNDLKGEFRSKRGREQRKWIRKCLQRMVSIWLTGQAFLYKKRFPKGPQKILYYHHCNAIGDPIMDLSQRFSLPEDVVLDVCYPGGIACTLFKQDPKIRNVYTDPKLCPEDYDAILLYDISPQAIEFKLSRYFFKPWSSILDHQQGERYARMPFMAIKLGRLFALEAKPLIYPRIFLNSVNELTPVRGRIAVAIGGGDSRRTYLTWHQVLNLIVIQCAAINQSVSFVLIGNGETARESVAQFSSDFIKAHCTVSIDLPDLDSVVETIASAEFFIGCDGGLMHIAQALEKPGVALFGGIKPEWRLHPDSQLQPLWAEANVNALSPTEIAGELMKMLNR